MSQYKRKGWYYYCNLAGVKPRNKPRKKTKYTSNSKLKRPSNPYTKRLAYLLGIARKYGHTDGDTITEKEVEDTQELWKAGIHIADMARQLKRERKSVYPAFGPL